MMNKFIIKFIFYKINLVRILSLPIYSYIFVIFLVEIISINL